MYVQYIHPKRNENELEKRDMFIDSSSNKTKTPTSLKAFSKTVYLSRLNTTIASEARCPGTRDINAATVPTHEGAYTLVPDSNFLSGGRSSLEPPPLPRSLGIWKKKKSSRIFGFLGGLVCSYVVISLC